MPSIPPRLEIRRSNVTLPDFPIAGERITLGRSPKNDLILKDDPTVSRHHACIAGNRDRYTLTDLRSSDGTYLNGEKLAPQTPHPVVEGDRIRIGTFELRFRAGLPSPPMVKTTVIAPASTMQATQFTQPLDLKKRPTFTIGRDPLNDLTIDHPAVSRFHAQIQQQDGSYYLVDLHSTNETFLNGNPIQGKELLKVGDRIRIGSYSLIFNGDETLVGKNEAGNLRLDAFNLNKIVGKGLNLLHDISLSIQPREFVAIAGVSGGGKSTLLDALNGFRPATNGLVLVNGIDLYKNFNAYRTEIGYVPQKDIVHLELTVEQALDYAAKLRMPGDTTRSERRKRVDEVLNDLGLAHRRKVAIESLSGGQLKRVSIGVELLTKPSLFFLDEATSGLDPGTEAEIMQLLRQLADQGRTILLITHATENVMLCDLTIFMAKGGHLAYFGPPQQAVQYFGVQRFNEIYRKVENERSPEEWQERYLRSHQYQEYVVQRQQSLNPFAVQKQGKRPRHQLPGANLKQTSGWRQFFILSQRNLAILLRDRASLILMLAVAPILGLLDLFAWQNRLFDVEQGDARLAIIMLFTTALIAVMVGSLATMREIVKESDIYRRERAVGLQILPYLFSKVWVSVLLALYQAAVFLGFKYLAADLPGTIPVLTGMYATLVLATIAGMVMGLLVSAISPNQNVAPLLTIIFLVPQIIFGGGVLPVHTFGLPGQVINHLSLTKWSFESLVTISGLGRDVAGDRCWQLPEGEREDLTDSEKETCDCLGRELFKTCEFPGIQEAYDPAVDEPEPEKPEDPGDPPPQPEEPETRSFAAQQQYQDELETFQEEMDEYQEKVEDYRRAIDTWQTEYSDWKGNYEGAIASAEGLIDSYHTDYGSAFDVNVGQHGLKLAGLSGLMFGLIIVAQKRKDAL